MLLFISMTITLISYTQSAVIFAHNEETTTMSSSSIIDDPNVCNRILTYNQSITVPVEVPYEKEVLVWCAAIPPRCKQIVQGIRWENQTEIHEKTKFFRQCCDGYTQDPLSKLCVPK